MAPDPASSGLRVKQSEITGAGLGVFATRPFAQHEVVRISYYTEVEADPTPAVSFYTFSAGPQSQHSALILDVTNLINHGGSTANVDYAPSPDGDRTFVYTARRPIARGEELLIDYGYDPVKRLQKLRSEGQLSDFEVKPSGLDKSSAAKASATAPAPHLAAALSTAASCFTTPSSGGCTGRDELFKDYGYTKEECASKCKETCGCVSYEVEDGSTVCHLSSSCDESNMEGPSRDWQLYLKKADCFCSPSPRVISLNNAALAATETEAEQKARAEAQTRAQATAQAEAKAAEEARVAAEAKSRADAAAKAAAEAKAAEEKARAAEQKASEKANAAEKAKAAEMGKAAEKAKAAERNKAAEKAAIAEREREKAAERAKAEAKQRARKEAEERARRITNERQKQEKVAFTEKSGKAPAAVHAVAVHADPMFKIDGKGTHFWVAPGQLTPLLEWPSAQGKFSLSGKVFTRAETGNQWFEQLVVKRDGDVVLDVRVNQSALGAMHALLDGRTIRPVSGIYKSALEGVTATVSDLPASSHVGHDDESAQQLLVHAAGLTLTIYPSKAAKFEAKREQDRNAHLNLRFEAGIPLDARGLFAELSGAVPMSEATRALLKHPAR